STLLPRSAFGQAAGRITLQFTTHGAGLSAAALVGALSGNGTATLDGLQISGFDPKALDAAVRAADRGVGLDAVRIGDVVRTALDAGRLHVPALAGTVTVDAGRVALAPLAAPAEGADVGITGSYDLGADALDLRFVLTGSPKGDAPDGQRPQLSIALKGPLEAPRRSVDVGPLVSWLTMRSLDLEAKRLQAAEQEAKRIQAEQEARRLAAEEAKRAAQAIEDARRAQNQEPTPPASTGGVPLLEKLPALPAPIEIRPPPGRNEAKPRRPAHSHTDRNSTMAAP